MTEPVNAAPGMAHGRWTFVLPVLLLLSFLLSAAHLWRAGQEGLALASVMWGLLCLRRAAWFRGITALLLFLLAAEWLVTAGKFIQIRILMDEPWLRLAIILSGVAALTQIVGFLVWSCPGQHWFQKQPEHAGMQTLSFLLVVAVMLPMALLSPRILLAERLRPGLGLFQVVAAALWAAWLCGQLMQRRKSSAVRLRVWRLFSLVFFGQFALAMMGVSILHIGEGTHIPVPAVIPGGALYRGEPGFMLLFFIVTVLLVGAAWCSHLCYFGAWDNWAATQTSPAAHAHPLRWRLVSLLLICAGAVALRLADVATPIAIAGGIALGIIMLPISIFISRRKGYAAYCTLFCPLGLLACVLGKLSFWRIRRTENCVSCGRCSRVCRYGALHKTQLESGSAGLSCTLCRDCLSACRHNGLRMSWAGLGTQGRAEQAFVIVISAMHAIFLFTAMA